mmetsp:Transcript_29634/g.76569  ORF Transcript_29634/g.76569 Transcript_29634/m.76569 type:complete len:159 (-) Transcript_29634:881-1357(-)
MTLPDKLEDRLELIEAVWKKYWKENALEKGKLGKASAFAVTGNTILGKEEPQQPQGEETPTLFCWLCYLEKNNRLPPGLELLDLPHQCEKDAKLPVQPQGFIYSGGYSSFKRHLCKYENAYEGLSTISAISLYNNTPVVFCVQYPSSSSFRRCIFMVG